MSRRQTAHLLQSSISSLKRWEQRGVLTAIKLPNKQVRYRREQVESLLIDNQ